jgi:hypothetical protein
LTVSDVLERFRLLVCTDDGLDAATIGYVLAYRDDHYRRIRWFHGGEVGLRSATIYGDIASADEVRKNLMMADHYSVVRLNGCRQPVSEDAFPETDS